MNRLLELRDSDIFPNTQGLEPVDFRERHAVRVVVSNELSQTALMWVKNRNLHKLPGGVDEAARIIEADRPRLEDYVGHFIQARDLAFLREVLRLRS